MNYIWDHAIKALQQGVDQDDIFYRYGQPFSPYMELSFIDINETKPQIEVEINPYYRYYSIFKELFEPNFIVSEQGSIGEGINGGGGDNANDNRLGDNESISDVGGINGYRGIAGDNHGDKTTVEVIHDIAIHHLKDIDVLMGMCRREYYIRFIIKDMHNGHFGIFIQENVSALTNEEQKIVANNILSLFETGECIHLLKATIRRIFTNAYVFSNAEEKDEIVFFLRTDETENKRAKIEVIKYLFLPFKCNILIYWQHIFGLIGVPEMMKMGETMNY